MKLSETKRLIVNSQLGAAGCIPYSFHLLASTLPSKDKKYQFSYHFILQRNTAAELFLQNFPTIDINLKKRQFDPNSRNSSLS